MNKKFKFNLFSLCIMFYLILSSPYAKATDNQCKCDLLHFQSPHCDESKNQLGPGKCATSCDCVSGRSCSNGECMTGNPCCEKCDDTSLTCITTCNLKYSPLDRELASCLLSCEITMGICKWACKGCPKPKTSKKDPLKKEAASQAEKKETHKESSKE